MHSTHLHQSSATRPRRHGRTLSSLLLGSLLCLFLVSFVYAGYLFLLWGKTAAGEVPDLPALSLPRIVRAAPPRAAGGEQQTDIFAQPAEEDPNGGVAPVASERVTLLVMGVDNRPDEPVARTDSILVLTMNPKTGSAGMLSLPRDLLVHSSALDRDVKINTLHVLGEGNNYPGGGPGLLSETVSELLNYPVDYYVRVNFDGFRQIIDLIGGIDIDVAKEIQDDKFPDENYGYDPLYIPAGRQHMDGALALKYARTRHGSNDYDRARRQQQVILAVKDKVMQPGQMASLLPRLPGLAIALAKTVQTNMPVDRALALARNLDQIDLETPSRVVVDQTMGQTIPDDPKYGFILVPDMNKLHAAAGVIFADGPASAGADKAAGASVAAAGTDNVQAVLAQVSAERLVVLNGSPQEGLAAQAAATLAGEGYNVVAVGNAERPDYSQTWLIVHDEAASVTRDLLVQRFGISPDHLQVGPESANADLTLILGADQAQNLRGQ